MKLDFDSFWINLDAKAAANALIAVSQGLFYVTRRDQNARNLLAISAVQSCGFATA